MFNLVFQATVEWSRYWQSLETCATLRGVFSKTGDTTYGIFLVVNAQIYVWGLCHSIRKHSRGIPLNRRQKFISVLDEVFSRKTCTYGVYNVHCTVICVAMNRSSCASGGSLQFIAAVVMSFFTNFACNIFYPVVEEILGASFSNKLVLRALLRRNCYFS